MSGGMGMLAVLVLIGASIWFVLPYLHRLGRSDPASQVHRLSESWIRSLIHADFGLTPEMPPNTRRMNDPLEPGVLRLLREKVAPIYHKLRGR